MNRFSALHAATIEADIFGEELPAPAAKPDATDMPTAPAAADPAAPASEKPRPVMPSLSVQPQPKPANSGSENNSPSRQKILDAKVSLHRKMLEEFNLAALEKLPRDALVREIHNFVSAYVAKERLALNNVELEEFVGTLVDEMTGLGPLEPLMRNPDISDILINGPNNCYAEIKGVLQPITIPFKDEAHLLRIVNKIVANVGRRIDEMNPMCDARMADGSRFNAAIRPIAIDGPLVSIRKFSKNKLSLDKLVEYNAIAPQMAMVLKHAVACRMTTIISGGTGTGKTTMLNALSAFIS